jgi:hypothetical protein
VGVDQVVPVNVRLIPTDDNIRSIEFSSNSQ